MLEKKSVKDISESLRIVLEKILELCNLLLFLIKYQL